MKRHLYIHNKKYRGEYDLYLLFVVMFAIFGVLSTLTFIIPSGELARDVASQTSESR